MYPLGFHVHCDSTPIEAVLEMEDTACQGIDRSAIMQCPTEKLLKGPPERLGAFVSMTRWHYHKNLDFSVATFMSNLLMKVAGSCRNIQNLATFGQCLLVL